MKKILLIICTLVFCFVINEGKAQSENPCFEMYFPDDAVNGYYNADSVMIDTCQNSASYKHLFAHRGWTVVFNENIFNGRLAPRGTILTRHDIDSVTFGSAYSEFQQFEEDFGDFWFERLKDTSVSSTAPVFEIYFQNYVDVELVYLRLSAGVNAHSTGFRYPFRLTGVENIAPSGKLFFIYPNPAAENITVSFLQNFSFKNITLKVRDLTGREIFLKEFSNEKSDHTFSLKEIPVGVYMLEVRSGNEFFTKQISVIR
ncbi:MAG: T9SS type A sorting domain-containing protein [Bacteroidota bacterium]